MHAQYITYQASTHTQENLFFSKYAYAEEKTENKYLIDGYSYGFNGMEKDDEVKSSPGTSYDYGARIYDPRVGRWLSVDRMEYKHPAQSPYNYVANSPLIFVDPDGNDYEVTVNLIKDANGTVIEKQVTISVMVKVINLTDQVVDGRDFNSGIFQSANKTFDFDTESYGGQIDDDGNMIDVPTSVNVKMDFQVVENITKVTKGDNVLLITDAALHTEVDNVLGVAERSGNVLTVEVGALKKSPRTTVHELGHILGLRDNYTTENGVLKHKGHGLMGVDSGEKVSENDLDELDLKKYNSNGEIISSGDLGDRVRSFADEHTVEKGKVGKLKGNVKSKSKPVQSAPEPTGKIKSAGRINMNN